MAKIDWTKPLEQMGGYTKIVPDLKYIGRIYGQHGYHVIRIANDGEGCPSFLEYSDDGNCHTPGWLAYKLRNLPEDPKNCIVLLPATDGTWFPSAFHDGMAANRVSVSPITRSRAEFAAAGLPAIIVEVPIK